MTPWPVPQWLRVPALSLCAAIALIAPRGAPAAEAPPAEASPSSGNDELGELSAADFVLLEVLNATVVSASKREESIDQAPNVMHVFNREQLRRRGVRNLRDLLMMIPGFTVLHRDLTYVSQVRGIAANSNDKVSLLINGVNVRGVFEDNYLTDLITLDQVERVEVIIGPGSVLYGAETLAAIVNIITPEPDGLEATLGAGSHDRLTGTVLGGRKLDDKRSMFASLTYAQSAGWDAFDSNSVNPTWEPLRGTDVFGTQKPSYLLVAKGEWDEWSMQAYSSNNSTPEYYVYTSAPGDRGSRTEYIDHISVAHAKQWGDKLSSNVAFGYYHRRIFRGLDYKGNTALQGQQSFDYTQTAYRFEPSLQLKLIEGNYLQLGLLAELAQNQQNYNFYWNPTNWADYRNASIESGIEKRDTMAWGFYLSDEHRFSEKIKLVGALRVDRNSVLLDTGWFLSPRLAAVYTPVESLTLKAMYNTATHFPTPMLSEMLNSWNIDKPNAASWLVNPATDRPERLTAYELQAVWSHQQRHKVSLNGYWQQLEDFIAWSTPFTNVGNFSGWGVELNYLGQVLPSLQLWGGGTFTRARFEDIKGNSDTLGLTKAVANSKGEMMAVPLATAVAGAEWSPLSGLTFAPQLNYLFRTPAISYESGTATEVYLDHRLFLNATVTWVPPMLSGLTLQLIGKNLTNNQQVMPMQFQTSTYVPRGLELEGVVSYRY